MSAGPRKEPPSLRIGIVGAGGIVRLRHAPGLARIPGVHVTAVANASAESARAFASEWAPGAQVFDDWKQLVDTADCDIIWIGATPHLHCAATCAALAAGRHVFCQARMARTLGEAERMARAAAAHPDRVTALCPPPMGMRTDLLVKQLLADEIIGRPHQLRLQSLSAAFLDPGQPAHWRQRREISGHQVLTFGIYVEVLQRWFGPISSVSAHGGIVHPVRDGYRVEIPDFLHVLCTFASGLEGVLSFSGVAAHAPGDLLEVFGERGTLAVDFTDETVRMASASAPGFQPVDLPDSLAREWTVERDFIAAVRDPSAPRPQPDFQEGLAYMRVVEAAHESLLRGRRCAC